MSVEYFRFTQAVTGVTPSEREAPIEMLDDLLATFQVSCFVAMYFANYDKLPCIGKVLAV